MRSLPINFALGFAIIAMSSCGAPLKKANQVKTIFSDTEQLNNKVADLCKILRSRSESPSLAGIGLANDICTKPGGHAVAYPSLKDAVEYTVINADSDSSSTGSGGVQNGSQYFTIRTRSEIWLKRSLLQLAQVLIGQLESSANSLLSSNNGLGKSRNEDFDFQVIGKPKFDTTNFSFALEFTLSSTRQQNGNVDLSNHFRVNGIMFDKKYFAALAETVGEQPVEKSLMNKGKILIILVPHAGDIFLDITTDLVFHSFNVNAAFKEKIVESLRKGLKSIPDLITKLANEQSQSPVATATPTPTPIPNATLLKK